MQPGEEFLLGLNSLIQEGLARRQNRAPTPMEGARASLGQALTDAFSATSEAEAEPATNGTDDRDATEKSDKTPRNGPRDWMAMTAGKLEQRLTRAVGKAIGDFNLIEEGDRILVAISGGKDSWAMLHILNEMRKRAPVHYELVAVNIDQGYAGFRQDVVEDFVAGKGYEYHMEYYNIAKIIDEKTAPGTTPCSLCSRLRRGMLYGLAEKHKCNKIALGHHADDFIETLLLNTFFVGKLASMAPKLTADDGKNVVIRPLVYVTEGEIKAFVKKMSFPIVCCQCPLMCGETVHGDYKRRMVKKMIDQLEVAIPHIRSSLLSSLGNIHPSHLLDKNLWDHDRNSPRAESAPAPRAEPEKVTESTCGA